MTGNKPALGFTLLEMLFVMLVIGLIFGLTAPRFGAGIDRYQMLSQRQEIEDQLRQLSRRARLAARTLELPKDLALHDMGDGAPAVRLPEGWTVTFSPPVVISRLGACSAANVTIQPADRTETPTRYRLTEPGCELLPETP